MHCCPLSKASDNMHGVIHNTSGYSISFDCVQKDMMQVYTKKFNRVFLGFNVCCFPKLMFMQSAWCQLRRRVATIV